MQFNPDPNKQVMKAYFLKNQKSILIPLLLRNVLYQKHLGIILDLKLDFNIHVDNKAKKCYKIIGIIKRLSISVPRKALLTIYKSFIRLHLEYGDILHYKPQNQDFQNKLEKVQYKACLTITGAITGTYIKITLPYITVYVH